MTYEQFLSGKRQLSGVFGFDPVWMPDFLYDFQKHLLNWALVKGRAAIFADCGLGKTPIQLSWAENVVRKTGGKVIILTPLAVAAQTRKEADKFGIEAHYSRNGILTAPITITNYHQLHKFDPKDFVGVVCDESSILKHYDGAYRREITDFMAQAKFRLLCTATAAPNDYVELGTSAEALGYMKRSEMLGMFFTHDGGETSKWRLKGHAERGFWSWVCSWARAVRQPSDLGCENDGFVLPPLHTVEHVVASTKRPDNFLFDMPAITLDEQRHERQRTIQERCGMAAKLAQENSGPSVCWCHLNSEGDLLTRLIPGSVQISGSDEDDKKEEALLGFAAGEFSKLVTKPSIAGFGMNWQHCSHQTFFPSHSFEQWYQATRRSWRFGQKNTVTVDTITSAGEVGVVQNMKRKTEQSEVMFNSLVRLIGQEIQSNEKPTNTLTEEIPSWL